MLKKKIKLTNSEKKLLEPESWLISITSSCLITHAGKCNLFVINTQCQIKNKQLLCFSQYLQHRFNYFDLFREVMKSWVPAMLANRGSFCIVSSELPLLQPPLFTLLALQSRLYLEMQQDDTREQASRTLLGPLTECHILGWGAIFLKRKHTHWPPKAWVLMNALRCWYGAAEFGVVCTFSVLDPNYR